MKESLVWLEQMECNSLKLSSMPFVEQHVGTQKHNLKQRNVSSKKGPENINNNEGAMICARICHELCKIGRPYTG